MKNFNFFEKLWEHSRTLRRVGLVLVMCLIAIPQLWATCPSYAPMYLTGAGTGGWQNTGTEWRLGSPASSSLADGNNFDEYCTYMWLNTNDYFGLNNNTNRYCRGDGEDQEIKGDKYGAGVFGYPGESKQKAFKYIGTTGLVRINAAGGNSDGEAYKTQGCWNPYVWVEESLETEILNGSKIMFYFGIASSWNCDWMYLCEEGDQNNDKAYKNYFKIHDDKCSSHITVAYVDANKKYYIGSGSRSGTYIKMTDNAVAGNLYSLNSNGSNNIYVNVGNKPHFATTSVSKEVGTTNSTIAATDANSIYGNAYTFHYYYTTDGGSTFTKFDPTDISDLTTGRYIVYALGWDGHILVKSDNSVTLDITVPITLNANGGSDGAVTSINATYGVAASGGNIAGGSLPTKTNYVFTGFYTSGGTKVINADGEWISNVSGYTDASGNWTCTAGSTLYAHWEDRYGFYGTGGDLGSWDVWKGLPNTATNTYSKSYSLTKNTTYTFKIVDRNGSGTWWGNSNTSGNLSITRSESGSAQQLYNTGGKSDNITITPDVTGSYTFSYNSSTNKLTITYPESYKVTYHNNGSTSGSVPTDNDYYLTGATVTAKDNTGKLIASESGKVFAGWNTASDGSGAFVDPADTENNTFTISSSVKDLYPIWKSGYYLITPDGDSFNTGDAAPFSTSRNIQSGSVEVNGVTFSSYNFYSSSAVHVIGTTYGDKHLLYDTQTNSEDIYIYAKGTGNLHYAIIKDGVAYTPAASDTVAVGASGKVFKFSINHDYKSRIILATSGSSAKIANIKVIKNGTALAAPCAAGYRLSFPGRAATAGSTKSGSIDGISLVSGSGLTFGTGNEFLPNSSGTHYAQFTIGSAVQLQVTTTDDDAFYVCTNIANPSGTGVEAGGSADTHNVDLSVAGTYYITPKSKQVDISRIAFATISSCTTPTALAVSDITSSGATLTVTDGSTRDYEFYISKSSTAPDPSDAATHSVDDSKTKEITGLDASSDYYAWVRTKCDNLNKSAWVALGTPGYFTTSGSCSATAPGALSKGTLSGCSRTITASGSAATNNTWYWQSSALGTDKSDAYSSGKTITEAGTYYLRSYCSDGDGCWSDAVSVEITDADMTPSKPTSMSAGTITATGATLSVTADGTATDYEFYVSTDDDAPEDSDDATHSVTGNTSKPISGLSNGTTYYAWVRAVCGSNKSGWKALTSSTFTTLHVYDVSTSLTNVEESSVPETATEGSAYNATFAKATGYNFPTTITVTINSSSATVDEDYTWNSSTGAFQVPAAKVTGDISISMTGVPQTYTISYKDKGGSDYSGSNLALLPKSHTYGSSTDLVNGVRTGYTFDGWFGNSSCTDVAMTSVGATAYSVDFTLYAKWTAKTYTVTLDPDEGSSTSAVTATYDADMPDKLSDGKTDVTAPSFSGYTFGGYYDDHAGAGTQYYTSTPASATTWDKASNTTLYAKWTQTVTLHDNHGGEDNTSATATWKGTGPFAPAATQTYSGHSLVDYRTSDGTTVLTKLGAFAGTDVSDESSVAYISSGKWAHEAATTLYAHWKCDMPTITDNGDNTVSITVPSGTTVRYTTDGTTPTSSTGTVYSAAFDIDADCTVKAIAYQSGCSDSEVAEKECDYEDGPCFVMMSQSDASKDSTISHNDAIIQGRKSCKTLTGGTAKFVSTDGSTSMKVEKGENKGWVFGSDKDQIVITLSPGSYLQEGTTIKVSGYTNSGNKGLKMNGVTIVAKKSSSGAFVDSIYTVKSTDIDLIGKNVLTITRISGTNSSLYSISISDCDYCEPITPTLSYSKTTFWLDEETDSLWCSPTLDKDGSTGTVTYSSSNSDIVWVGSSTGNIYAQGRGVATITASIAADGTHCASEATCKIIVKSIECGTNTIAKATRSTTTASYSGLDGGSALVNNLDGSSYKLKAGGYVGVQLPSSLSFKEGDKIRIDLTIGDWWKGGNVDALPVVVYADNTGTNEIYRTDNYTKNTAQVVEFSVTSSMLTALNTSKKVTVYRQSSNPVTQNHVINSVEVKRNTCPDIFVFNDAENDQSWSTAGNWMGKAGQGTGLPKDTDRVYIKKSVSVDATTATAGRVHVTNGSTMTVEKNVTMGKIDVETGSTLHVAKDGESGITLLLKTLHLVGGFGTVNDETKYDMPRVYIDPASTITKTNNVVNFDIAVNNRSYYPFALPFDVPLVISGTNAVDYANSYFAYYSNYGLPGGQYAIKTYNGQKRANSGSSSANWEQVSIGTTLKAGTGYALSAMPADASGYNEAYAVIRFPMVVDGAWTIEGEQGSVEIDDETVTKNVIPLTAYKKTGSGPGTGDDTPKKNMGWNLLGVPFMSCYQTGADMYSGDGSASIIQGKLDYKTNQWDDKDNVRYVTVPNSDFTEYAQYNIVDDDTKLLPGWCFFVQVETSGDLTFLSAKEAQDTELPYEAPRREKAMPTVKTGIILSGAEASDKTTILVSDKYSAADYEINADLEKMFGDNGYTLATYTLSGETRLAYNAMNNSDIMNVIPVGYRAPEEGEYTFSINPRYAESEAFEQVNLIDYEEGVVTNLLQSSYSFTTARTQNDARFAINVVKRQDTATDIETVGGEGINDANAPRKVLINDKMYIILDGKMYDATGKSVK